MNKVRFVIFLLVLIAIMVIFAVFVLYLIGNRSQGPDVLTINFTYQPGSCYANPCSEKVFVKKNGYVIIDTRVGENFEETSNNESRYVYALNRLIDSEDFSSISSNKYDGTCPPPQYNGSRVVYVFNTSEGNITIDNCAVLINQSAPLFNQIQIMLNSINSQ